VWGNALDDDDNIVWGNTADDDDNIVWGNLYDDNIVWGNSLDDDNIVWGNAFDDDDNIVWGNSSVTWHGNPVGAIVNPDTVHVVRVKKHHAGSTN
jgi:hypothetical protein